MVEEKTAKTKVKRKKWISVIAPELFRNEPIGDVPVNDPKSLINRTITANLMTLTRDMKRQNTNIKFIITNIKGGGAVTDFYGYYLNTTSIKRLVRRGKEKIGISIICKTSDNKKVRIMPLIISYTKVKGSVAASFRRDATSYLRSYAAKTTFENMIKDLITNKLQRDLKGAIRKVYPIRILEIAQLHIEREKKSGGGEVEVEVKEEPKEEKTEEPKEANKVEEKEVEEEKEESEEAPKK